MHNERAEQVIPPDVVDLVELLAEKLDRVQGDTRLELIYKDGVLRIAFLHADPVDRHELRRRYRAA